MAPPSSRKRPIDFIDLSQEDDDAPFDSSAPYATPVRSRPTHSDYSSGSRPKQARTSAHGYPMPDATESMFNPAPGSGSSIRVRDLAPQARTGYGHSHSHAHSSFPRSSESQRVTSGPLRRVPSGSSQRGPSSSQRLPSGSSRNDAVWIDDESEDEGSQEVPGGTQETNTHNYVLYGTLKNKIVGVRFYNGYAGIGEMVICRREPQNPYDRNAIQVLNVQGVQIGHIPKEWAARLAKYMDNRSLVVEGEIAGSKGAYDCPLLLKYYGTNVPIERENLMNRMQDDRLPVKDANAQKRQEAADEKAMRKRWEAAKKAREKAEREARKQGVIANIENINPEFMAGSSQGMGPGPSLEDIIGSSERFAPRNFEQMVEEFGAKEDDLVNLPKAAQPDALSTQLHPFQLQGLQWMLEKESPQLPAPGSKNVVQLWGRHPTLPNFFINHATNYSTKTPELFSGGILADDMGLGKTIQTISLIMADRALGRKMKDTCDATLILAPVSVMSNWSTQMKKHVKEKYALRVMFWHGTRKESITPKEIQNYDVVISTYESVSADWHSQQSQTLPRRSGPFSIKWRRIILDEAHGIRNPKAKKSVAICNLLAQSRWSLTGTPIINNLKDLYSQVRFLRLSGGLNTMEVFHAAIMRPVLQGSVQGNKALQTLMSGICLRRKKEMGFIDLRLPELTEYVHKITLHPHEQEKYDILNAQAKGTLEDYKKKAGGKDGFAAYSHLLEILLRMRQVCNHWQLMGEERLGSIMKQLEDDGMVDLTPENKAALQQMLQLSIDSHEECAVCMDPLSDPVITKCAHSFCSACLERVIELQHKCPMCRAELESLATTTVKPAKEKRSTPLTQEEIADKDSLDRNASTKVTAMLDILKASSKDPTNKTIVFSQWTSFLDIVQSHLVAQGFKFTRIDGSMNATQRDAALEALDSDPDTTIMLASLSVCSVGLNLVAANQVILSDSWWAPAIEDQAVDRVHRLGQKRKTKVFRLVVEGSIEQRVLNIQEDKRKLMGLAFAEKADGKRKKKGTGSGMADLMRLLGEK